jgi:hypothetical protein
MLRAGELKNSSRDSEPLRNAYFIPLLGPSKLCNREVRAINPCLPNVSLYECLVGRVVYELAAQSDFITCHPVILRPLVGVTLRRYYRHVDAPIV